jgi:hypothetical protein
LGDPAATRAPPPGASSMRDGNHIQTADDSPVTPALRRTLGLGEMRVSHRARFACWLASRVCAGHYIRLEDPPAPTNEPRWGHGRPYHSGLASVLQAFEPVSPQPYASARLSTGAADHLA